MDKRADHVLVTRELAKPTESNVEHHAVSSATSPKEVSNIKDLAPADHALFAQIVCHFGHLEGDNGVGGVPVCMILYDQSSGFVMTVLCDEPFARQYKGIFPSRTRDIPPRGLWTEHNS